MSKTALVILARAPEEGKVKTRLAATIGTTETLRLYKAFLCDLACRFTGDKEEAYTLHWAYTPIEADFVASLTDLAPTATPAHCFPQCGPDLASRLHHAFRTTTTFGFQQTILRSRANVAVRNDPKGQEDSMSPIVLPCNRKAGSHRSRLLPP